MLLQLSQFFPFAPSARYPHFHPQIPSIPPQFISTGYVYKFFGFSISYTIFLKILFIFERGERREKEREGETSMWERYIDRLLLAHPQLGTWPTTQACALSGNQTSDLLFCRLALNPLSHTNQGSYTTLNILLSILYLPIILLFKKYFFKFIFRERGRGEKERETSVCGCLSSVPYWGPGLQPRHVPWLGIEPATVWFTD